MNSSIHNKIKAGRFEKAPECLFLLEGVGKLYKTVELILEIDPHSKWKKLLLRQNQC